MPAAAKRAEAAARRGNGEGEKKADWLEARERGSGGKPQSSVKGGVRLWAGGEETAFGREPF